MHIITLPNTDIHIVSFKSDSILFECFQTGIRLTQCLSENSICLLQ
ncbi:hypothetical protein HMPREF9370_2064 [Neisseria wadsworthii 9715]|uniref:Uncharacterized protein n=1 Tax=Neisseria wadsworthii 9715 TaxID=1030841 RepID=G4CSK4_9NEIS|nr:hypothetical protein HMPREF9370_2064 [Neisseria wadsworthii 9715]